jgi:glycosyltransferase involved in cell wall biosynthesis
MRNNISISVVIPTCNRKESLLRLLTSLNNSTYVIHEVVIVDAGSDGILETDFTLFTNLTIKYLLARPSVCAQRNIGINEAAGDWIFLCDDDMEVPAEYLVQLTNHIDAHSDVGALAGIVLQLENGKWIEQYSVRSSLLLFWNFIFQLSIWGEITCNSNNQVISKVKMYYKKKGNHISKAGWPILSDFSGEYFKTPVYGLGASLIKKQWLLKSPFDEALDANGIGDNYGVAVGFPSEVHVLNKAFVYHHRELTNRASESIRSGRRIFALHYFIKILPALKNIKLRWFLWSLVGLSLSNLISGNRKSSWIIIKNAFLIISGGNPYLLKEKQKQHD